MIKFFLIILCALSQSILDVYAYDFPVKNPYSATVLGTPEKVKFKLTGTSDSDIEKLRPFPDRRVPAVFWYGNNFRVGIDLQDADSAPLIFILAGTGSNFESAKTRFLKDVFFAAGFHVVSLSSTITDEFITSGSTSSRPGYLGEDAKDLYRIMKLAYDEIWPQTRASEFHLTGFSIGALYSAWLGELDSHEKYFKFKKILMLNPPVNLYRSAVRMDRLIDDNLVGGISSVGSFVERIFQRYATQFNETGGKDTDSEFLFTLLEYEPLSPAELKVLIGVVFRLAASTMAFTSDVMTNSGKLVSAKEKLTTGDTLTGYFKQSLHWGFIDYFKHILLPYIRETEPGITQQELIDKLSLSYISNYLATTPSVGVVTNQDDFILNKSELEFLTTTFGDRATVYSHGGHGGNIEYTENVHNMLNFFGATIDQSRP